MRRKPVHDQVFFSPAADDVSGVHMGAEGLYFSISRRAQTDIGR
jgi:hypothetical protein